MRNNRRSRIALLGFIVSVLISAGLSAQTTDAWYYNKKIRSIDFEGLTHVTNLELSGVTTPFIGKGFTDALYGDLLNKVYALDLFEDISPVALPGDAKGDTVVIKFTVTERPFISKISFSGNKQVRSSELKEAVSVKEKDIYVSSKVLLDERAVRDVYLKKGYTNIRVSSEANETDSGVEIVFNVNEGRSTVVKSISFMGNQVVAAKTLKGLLGMKEAGLFNKGAFQESQLEIDKNAILTYYNNRGYADAAILDVVRTTTYNEENNSDELDIRFVIQEGTQYTFGGVTFTGNVIFSSETLRALVKLQDGAVFNQTKFQEGMYAVTDLYYENGYTSNYFNPEMSKDADAKQISVRFVIIERPRSHIENIIIKGNTKTKEHVIRRELPIETGDIFSKAKVTSGLRNLFNLQFFSAIVPDIVSGSEENLVDLILNVEEQSTTAIEFGVTFSGVADPNAFPVSLFFNWKDSNVFGTGKAISASTVISTDNQSLSLSYSDSWFLGMPVSVGVSAEVAHSSLSALRKMFLPDGTQDDTSYYMNYEKVSMSLSASLGRRWVPDFAIFSLSGGIVGQVLQNFYDANVYIPVDSTLASYHGNWGIQNSVWASASVDMRDVSFDPSSGWFTSERVAWTGFFPQIESEFFFRSDTKAEGYLTLLNVPVSETWNLKFVLAGLSTLSFIEQLPGSELSSTNKLYIDGMFTGRGWSSIYNTNRTKALWSNTVELRMPVAPGIFSLDFFFDAAALKEDAADMFTSLKLDDFYFSFGPGFRFSLQQFPLRLLLANTFQIKNGSVEWRNGTGPEWQFVLSFNLTNR